jgi:phage virion morphogenesis protein
MMATVGTNEPYAAIHQFGGKAGRGRKVDIPARPFLALTPQDKADILEDIQDYFQRLIKVKIGRAAQLTTAPLSIAA